MAVHNRDNFMSDHNIPDPPAEAPEEQALAYLDYVSEAVSRQIATAQVEGQKVPTVLFLPPPPRPYDRQLIQSFIPYLFANQFDFAPVPEIRFTSKSPDKIS
jgi:hypothetical protein